MSDAAESNVLRGWRPSLVEWALILLALLLLGFVAIRAIGQARDAARYSQAKNNLKQIGLGLHNYHDTFNTLPPGGVFNAQEVPYHCWTTALDPYLWASSWYSQVDFSVPWDDPAQIDLFLRRRDPVWTDPRLIADPRPDGLSVTTYAANSWLMHRNSSVSFQQIGTLAGTLLAAESRGQDLPLGCPGNWRDVPWGLNQSEASFGFRGLGPTLALRADGSVVGFPPETNPDVWNALAGPTALRPPAARLRRVAFPYKLPDDPEWRTRRDQFEKNISIVYKSDSQTRYLVIDFKQAEPPDSKHAGSPTVRPKFESRISWELLTRSAERKNANLNQVTQVIIRGRLNAAELEPLTRLKRLERLTLSGAALEGDLSILKAQLGRRVTVID